MMPAAPKAASLQDRRRARVQLAWALHQQARHAAAAAALTATASGDPDPGEYLTYADRARAYATDAAVAAVIAECTEGTPWRTIAARRGITPAAAADFYGGLYATWLAGDPHPWRPSGADGFGPTCPADLDAAVRVITGGQQQAPDVINVEGLHAHP